VKGLSCHVKKLSCHAVRGMAAHALVVVAALSSVGIGASPAEAHKPSDSYLTMRVEGAKITGQWDIALRDLDYAIGLDTDDDGAITWGEVRAGTERIAVYAFSGLRVALGGTACTPRLERILADAHADGAYAVLRFSTAGCEHASDNASLALTYSLFAEVDPLHRGLVSVDFVRPLEVRSSTGYDAERGTLQSMLAGHTSVTVLGPDRSSATFERRSPGIEATVAAFVQNGIWHIWTGFDHVLFLVSLLLPAVTRRENDAWRPVGTLREALTHTAKVVTAFTVAHSITLSVAALGIVDLPSRLVESAIALSVAVAAANNVVPLFDQRRAWQIAMLFGLIHGFGFASVLTDSGLGHGALVWALVSFNLGVEIGQLAIVAVLLPLAFAYRRTAGFRWGVLTAGSVAIVLIALGWLGERALDVRLF
jgi:HupE / UreJ protein